MGLFKKNLCTICGNKVGFFTSHTLDDGIVCKECFGKLSPFFVDDDSTSVADIKDQLAYREKNRMIVREFETTKMYGQDEHLFVDQSHHTFMIGTGKTDQDVKSKNPDVIAFSSVKNMELKIEEEVHEELNGDMSYFPRRFILKYDFYIAFEIDSPYFSEARFKINDKKIVIKRPTEYVPESGPKIGLGDSFLETTLNRKIEEDADEAVKKAHEGKEVDISWRMNYPDYAAMKNECEAILEELRGYRQ